MNLTPPMKPPCTCWCWPGRSRRLRAGPSPRTGAKVWHIGRVCVRKAFRGRELGRLVMEGLEKAVAGEGGEKVVLSAQVQARGFYEKLGYTAHGPEYLDEHCPHVEMEKRL